MLVTTTIDPNQSTRSDYQVADLLEPLDNTGTPIINQNNLPVVTNSFGPGYDSNGTPIINQSNLPVTALQRWNWKKALIGAITGFLTGGPAGALIGGVTGGLLKGEPPVLPSGEFETITSWIQNQFAPYINTITKELNALLASNLTAASLPQLNEISTRLGVIRNFYANDNSDTFLSQEGINYRNTLVEPICLALENLIRTKAKALGSNEQIVTVNNNKVYVSSLPQPQTGVSSVSVYSMDKSLPSSVKNTTVTPGAVVAPSTEKNEKHQPLLWLGIGTVIAAFLFGGNKKTKK